MARKKLNEGEIAELLKSPFVLAVDEYKVYFSAEFKEMFWERMQKGRTPRRIFKDLGIDPEILGKERLKGFKQMLRHDKASGKGFRDIRSIGKEIKSITAETEVEQLKQRLAYKEQEIEFLKKIASLGYGDKYI